MRLGVLATHPIQYHAPLYRELARRLDLHVYFAHRQTPQGQAAAGFGVEFEWDVPLLDGYSHTFLSNRSSDPGTATFSGCDTPEIRRIIGDGRFDAFCVNGWYNRSFLQAITACWRTKTPIMVRGDSHLGTPRRPLVRAAKELMYRQFIPRFDRYLYVGARAREYYEHFGADPARMRFSPHHVDNRWFAERAAAVDREAVRATLGVDSETLLVLFVGKFIPEKRVDDLMAAVSRVHQDGPSVHLLLVGAGPLEEDLRRQAAGFELTPTFAGFKNQSELPTYYAAADVLVLPSVSETWGLAVNEAMACGLPAIVSDAVGCAPDLVDDGLTGFTFPTGDTERLARALARSVGMRRDEAVQQAIASKVREYSVERAADGFIEAVEVEYV